MILLCTRTKKSKVNKTCQGSCPQSNRFTMLFVYDITKSALYVGTLYVLWYITIPIFINIHHFWGTQGKEVFFREIKREKILSINRQNN